MNYKTPLKICINKNYRIPIKVIILFYLKILKDYRSLIRKLFFSVEIAVVVVMERRWIQKYLWSKTQSLVSERPGWGGWWGVKKPETSWIESLVSSLGNSGCHLMESGIKEEIFILPSSIYLFIYQILIQYLIWTSTMLGTENARVNKIHVISAFIKLKF